MSAAFAPMDTAVLCARLENIRDLDPPMSIIALNQLIAEVAAVRDAVLADHSRHSGYEIGSGGRIEP